MEIEYHADALSDREYWIKSGDKAIQKKISKLIVAIIENPFDGIGKPEPLKYQYTGLWSRRINKEHRLIYRIEENLIKIYSMKGHY